MTVFKKDITRFAPAWIGYTLVLLICLMLMAEDSEYWTVRNMASSMSLMGVATCGYALLTAQLLFGDLFNTRMCNALHAMPVRRERWFGVHVLSGLLFHLIPAVLVTLVAIPMANMSYVVNAWQVPLYWLAGSTLDYLFFFGLAVFCVMCTGNRFAMAVVYGIANLGSVLLFFVTRSIYAPLLMGVQVMSDVFENMSPLIAISSGAAVDVERIKDGFELDEFGVQQAVYHGEIRLDSEKWIYMAVIAVIGLVLLVLALQMYRKRKLECAGDFSAYKMLDYVFQVLISLSGMAGLTTVVDGFFGMDVDKIPYVIAAIGLVAGWFIGRMLMERSTRVFRVKNFLGLAAMAAAVALSLGLTVLDPLGIEDWVPAVEDIRSAQLRLSYNVDVKLEEKEDLEDLLAIHEKGLALKLDGELLAVNTPARVYDTNGKPMDPEVDPAYYVTIIYEKNNGLHAQREYYIWLEEPETELVRKHCGTLSALLDGYETDERPMTEERLVGKMLSGGVDQIVVGGVALPESLCTEENIKALAAAIAADCEAGTLVQNSQLHGGYIIQENDTEVTSFYLSFDPAVYDDGISFSLQVYADSENVLRWIENQGIMDDVIERYKE